MELKLRTLHQRAIGAASNGLSTRAGGGEASTEQKWTWHFSTRTRDAAIHDEHTKRLMSWNHVQDTTIPESSRNSKNWIQTSQQSHTKTTYLATNINDLNTVNVMNKTTCCYANLLNRQIKYKYYTNKTKNKRGEKNVKETKRYTQEKQQTNQTNAFLPHSR